jgi:hypothetical protein
MGFLEGVGISREVGIAVVALGVGLAVALGVRLFAGRSNAPRRTVIDLNGR